MHGVKEIIEEAECLPVEERVMVIDSLLRTINPPLAEVEIESMMVAKRRLAELRSGQVEAVPRNEVFAKIRDRFERDPSASPSRFYPSAKKRSRLQER